MTKIDVRKAFAGADPAEQIRKLAKSMMDIGLQHAEEKRRAALHHAYTNYEQLEVEVRQVRLDPPLWRMETVVPVTETSGRVVVEEPDRAHLEPELRLAVARALMQAGHVQTWDEAKERVKQVKVHVQGAIIRPRDSEKWLGERRRR